MLINIIPDIYGICSGFVNNHLDLGDGILYFVEAKNTCEFNYEAIDSLVYFIL